jgi:hypothetical protein
MGGKSGFGVGGTGLGGSCGGSSGCGGSGTGGSGTGVPGGIELWKAIDSSWATVRRVLFHHDRHPDNCRSVAPRPLRGFDGGISQHKVTVPTLVV